MKVEGRLVEQGFEEDALTSWPLCHEAAHAVERLIVHGICLEGQLSRSAYCPDCDVYHRVEQGIGHTVSMSCAAGTRPVDAQTLRRWKIDTSGLLHFLKVQLQLDREADLRVEGAFWFLGLCDPGGGPFPVWLLRHSPVQSRIGTVLQSLEKRSPAEAGVILVCRNGAEDLSWPRGSKACRLGDLFAADGDELSLDQRVLLDCAPRNRQPKGGPGRPSKSKLDVRKVFRDRVRQGLASKDSLANEANALREIEVLEVGEARARSARSIENMIRSDYRAYGESDFREEVVFPQN